MASARPGAAKAYGIARRHDYVDVHAGSIAEWVADVLGISVGWAYEIAQKDIDALQASTLAISLQDNIVPIWYRHVRALGAAIDRHAPLGPE